MAKSATKTTTTRPAASREPRAPTPARVPAEPASAPGAAGDTAQLPATRAALPTIVPIGQGAVTAFDQSDVGKGMEHLREEDVAQPRLKLIQGISPELQTYDELKAGYFFHTLQEAIFDEPFIGVPLAWNFRYILWNPRSQGGGILARADDGVHWDPPDTTFRVKLDPRDGGHEVTWHTARTVKQSGLDRFGTYNPNVQGSPPAATLMYTFLLGFPMEPGLAPAVLTFQRSATKAGKDFNTKLGQAIRAGCCMYQCAYRFESFVDTNKRGEHFHNIRATAAGTIPPNDPILVEYQRWFRMYQQSTFKIDDLEGAADEGSTIEGDAPKEGAPAF